MADARVEKLAQVIVNYSLEWKPGQTFWLHTTPLAEALNLPIYAETVKAAVGLRFAECGRKKKSGLHWDILCDRAESEIKLDGDLFYRDGKPVIE